MRDFLKRVGTHWAPLEFQFDKLVIAENAKIPGSPHPALSGTLLEFVFRSGEVGEPITLDRVVDAFSADDPDEHRAF